MQTTQQVPQTFNIFDSLKTKIETGQARIGVVGLGYVGLPLACAYANEGFSVTGFELDLRKINSLEKGISYIGDVPGETVRELSSLGRLKATMDFDLLIDQDAIIICVPTPLRKTKDPDISYIVSATQQIRKRVRPGQLIILESTTYPGTTKEILLSTL
ncbi:MAG: UDP-N-acetyl-D-glucosamine dehydrogenase, partial [Elusimicrobia bacterium]|nr:UDP-N-acetyl-D-glucosamine dehydrogenase [Elusimicrobiota bacterium]